jgi:large repetitive protein
MLHAPEHTALCGRKFRGRGRYFAGLMLAAAVMALLAASGPARADVGYRDFTYVGATKPTGDKPQSKLWFNDGVWWGSLFNSFTGRFEIYRLDASTQAWSTTGTVVDERKNAGVDAAWSGGKLYVAGAGLAATSALDSVRVRRYSYNSASKSYTLDAGYPVTVSTGGVENAVIDRDSGGTAWVTYTRDQKVYVAHSTGTGATWTAPYVLPAAGADTITPDDISAMVAYSGRIGVMWSNQNDWTMYFASHRDGDPDDAWSSNPAISAPEYADDHINLKSLDADPSGKVFAATKTSLNAAEAPLILLLVLDNNGTWQRHTFGRVIDNHTRMQVAIDREHRQLYMFATSPCCNGGAIYYKQTSLDRVNFAQGLGTPFIQSSTDTHISNVSTTKQSVTGATGLVAIAGDDDTRTYFHNMLDLSTADSTPPDTVIESGPQEAANTPSATFTFSADEAGSTFDCSLDGAAFAECSSPATYIDLANGSHTLRVRAADAADNVDATPAERTWTVTDTTTAVSVPTAADTYAREAFPDSDFGSETKVQTDGGTGVREEGYFKFNVAGVAHSVESAKLRAYVTNGSINGPAIYATGSSWTEGGLTWNNRPGATGAPSEDKGQISSGWTTYNVTPLVKGNGTQSFVTTQTSTDGTDVNSREYTSRPPTLELKIDPAPETIIDSGPNGAVNATSAEFGFSSSQTGATFACSLDGGAYASCSAPRQYPGLADGSHTFRVRATNSSGKSDPTPVARTWTVDTVAPAPPTVALAPAYDSGRSSTDGVTSDSTPHFVGTAEAGGIASVYDGGSFLGTTAVDAAGGWEFQPEALADGPHSITVRAADAAGNLTWGTQTLIVSVDTEPPAAPLLTSPVNGTLTASSMVTLAGTAEADAAVELFDGVESKGATLADAAGNWTGEVDGLPDGPRSLTATAIDVAGNVSPASEPRTVMVDTIAPETSISAGPNDPTTRTTASFELSSSEPGSRFECRLDDAPFVACESLQSYAELADGSHGFAARAIDAAGNIDPTPATWSWTINPDGPRAPVLTSPPDGSHVASTTITVAGSAQPGVRIEVFDGDESNGLTDADADGNWSLTLTALSDGVHVLTATATDAAGLTSAHSQAHSVSIDTVAPQTTIESGPAPLGASSSATLTFSSDEAGVSFECRLDDGTFAACVSPDVVTALVDGSHAFEVRAVDAAGNADATPARHVWTVDTTPPETTINTAAALTADATPEFTFEASESGSTFECAVDDGPFESCVSPTTVAPQADGQHLFSVRATDPAGNGDPTPAAHTFTVDRTSPDVTVTSPTANSIVSGTVMLAAAASDAVEVAAVKWYLDDVQIATDYDGAPWGKDWDSATVADGQHQIFAKARDAAGNWGTSPKLHFTVRNTVLSGLETIIDSGPALTNDRTPDFFFSATDAGATFECAVDGGPFEPCTSPKTLPQQTDGDHAFAVRAIDSSNNPDPTPASRAFTIDTARPSVSVTSPVSGTTVTGDVPFGANATDLAGITAAKWYMDGVEVATDYDGAPWEKSWRSTNVPNGTHKLYAKARDAAGNWGSSPSITILVDN